MPKQKKQKLEVRNNWENLEWSWNGKRLLSDQLMRIDTIDIDGIRHSARSINRRSSYTEQGQPHPIFVNSRDIALEIRVHGVNVDVSLYDHQLLLAKVRGLYDENGKKIKGQRLPAGADISV